MVHRPTLLVLCGAHLFLARATDYGRWTSKAQIPNAKSDAATAYFNGVNYWSRAAVLTAYTIATGAQDTPRPPRRPHPRAHTHAQTHARTRGHPHACTHRHARACAHAKPQMACFSHAFWADTWERKNYHPKTKAIYHGGTATPDGQMYAHLQALHMNHTAS